MKKELEALAAFSHALDDLIQQAETVTLSQRPAFIHRANQFTREVYEMILNDDLSDAYLKDLVDIQLQLVDEVKKLSHLQSNATNEPKAARSALNRMRPVG